ncbi:MAG: bifunctional phosphoribosylaminoimidazolecarboxamide formyltransferase/IMP cyclohydrolase [Alphaproteobacteria bacterium]|nr:bifunctional phosphoribosylaminoimidazolecarboxamide formyltransferase/IMP cyclohydrolase [Alphaproteobacteria bacterium]
MEEKAPDIRRALISVSDKSGLEELAAKLHSMKVEIISSGGTGKFLQEKNIPFTPIEEVTGNPECFGGRMKTLSFEVFSSLLFRRGNTKDLKEVETLNIKPIDLVVCNLYPFEEVAKRPHIWDELIENIDIGGPSMIRAAAKNYKYVGVVTDPSLYGEIIHSLNEMGGFLHPDMLQKMALEAFRHTARYDAMIAAKMEEKWHKEIKTIILSPEGVSSLRYGENPHQKAWVYTDTFNAGIAGTTPLQGKALSYNNLLDADTAWRCCGDAGALNRHEFSAAVSIIKHLSPCGAALAKTSLDALQTAWDGDPISSFGGVVCFNQKVESDVAEWLNNYFVEVIIAPDYSPEALDIFSSKKNLRLLKVDSYDGTCEQSVVRSISGGWVVQEEDTGADTEFKQATKIKIPSEKKVLTEFGVMACKYLKSNAIGIFGETSKGFSMIGAGMGNPNRVVSMRQAVEKARENGHKDLSEAILVSDAFFPFPDNIDIAEEAGIRYIVQPGGSIKDKDVIQACDEAEIAMTFTGRRHFRH